MTKESKKVFCVECEFYSVEESGKLHLCGNCKVREKYGSTITGITNCIHANLHGNCTEFLHRNLARGKTGLKTSKFWNECNIDPTQKLEQKTMDIKEAALKFLQGEKVRRISWTNRMFYLRKYDMKSQKFSCLSEDDILATDWVVID